MVCLRRMYCLRVLTCGVFEEVILFKVLTCGMF